MNDHLWISICPYCGSTTSWYYNVTTKCWGKEQTNKLIMFECKQDQYYSRFNGHLQVKHYHSAVRQSSFTIMAISTTIQTDRYRPLWRQTIYYALEEYLLNKSMPIYGFFDVFELQKVHVRESEVIKCYNLLCLLSNRKSNIPLYWLKA